MSDLIEGSWILIFASAYNMLQCISVIWIYEKNSFLHKYIIGKERNMLAGFLRYWWVFFVTVLKLDSCLLKGSCDVESDIISVKFPYSATLKLISLSCILNNSFPFVWFYNIMHCPLKNTNLLSYLNPPNVDVFHYKI